MKLKEYLEELNKMVLENPEILEYVVVYSRDDEGNGFQEVHYTPDLGVFDEEEREFHSESDIEEDEYSYYSEMKEDNENFEFILNSICIN